MHNIAEGFESGSDPEFIRFLRYSLRSAAEVQSQLYLALELNYLDQPAFDSMTRSINELKNNLHGFIAYLSKSVKARSLREPLSDYIVEYKEDFGDT